ncbi:SAM-dependent DNA methyltransferase [Haloarcula sp. CBA1130]|uniref:HsdM family class I SAM-dependent methyltransferase n=2 Tax=unclassified Haloarcula TaxID=2624677 RepID=UPI001248256F|nr:class I SAM-dependent DNA methyltransferase [Haloarcula sp. CBA1130]KAA9396254.1 SAM-dependent DNA methyltransferase [Haloarcula sp. CBA1130]KAA9398302.1 SAM-dependent DNA methyltransferase [Haloarcula sp. CBA1129]
MDSTHRALSDGGSNALVDVFEDCIDEMKDDDGIDKTEYREFLLPLIFYKAANDTYRDEYEDAVTDFGEEIANEDPAFYRLQIPDGYLWEDLLATNKRVDETLNQALEEFEELNQDLGLSFEVDYLSFETDESTLKTLLQELDAVNISVENVDYNAVSDAYMALIRRFAKEEDRDAGEFYQPEEVIEMVVRMLSPFENGDSFYDPTTGSGDMLVGVASHYRDEGKEPNKLTFVGQESIKGMTEAANLNFFLNDIEAEIEAADPLDDPMRTSGGSLREFDYVLTNFPYSEDWNKSALKDDTRFGYVDKDPRKNRADYAYILHMFSSLNETGQLATLAPQGVLFRDGESPFREFLINEDLVEAVINLPKKLFGEDTGIAPTILFLNKDKPEKRDKEVLFLNTAHEDFYRELDNENQLTPEGVDRAVEIFNEWESEERKSRVVDVEEIEETDYNLNLALYVDTTEPEEDLDTVAEAQQLAKLETELSEIRDRMKHDLRELYGEGVNQYE